MKIVSPLNALDQLRIADTYIIFGYIDKDKAEAFLQGLNDLTLSAEPYFDEHRKTMTISPVEISHTFQYSHLPPEIVKKFENYTPKQITIPDFKDSERLYEGVSARKSTLKIIEDKYSGRRGLILFEYVSEIEKGLRLKYKDFYDTDQLKESERYRRGPDHFINYYTLSEMVNEQLLAPASDEYYLRLLETAEDKDGKLVARSATRLEELGLPLSPDELKSFITIRNAVMHFRVVTHRDSEVLLALAEEYQHFVTKGIFKMLQSRKG